MNLLLIQSLISGLFFWNLACNQQPLNKTYAKTDTFKQQTSISPYQQELNNALNDPTVDNYYKEIYRKEKLIRADDSKMLSVTDSLFTKDLNKDLFYFIVFTKSMNGSDGFYAEAMGAAAFKFITTKTEWFADYFNIAPKLTENDFENWAGAIFGEIQISREKEEVKAIKELEIKLNLNIREARKEYKPIIEKLIRELKSMANKSGFK